MWLVGCDCHINVTGEVPCKKYKNQRPASPSVSHHESIIMNCSIIKGAQIQNVGPRSASTLVRLHSRKYAAASSHFKALSPVFGPKLFTVNTRVTNPRGISWQVNSMTRYFPFDISCIFNPRIYFLLKCCRFLKQSRSSLV